MTSPLSQPPSPTATKATQSRWVRPKWIALVLLALIILFLVMNFADFQKKAVLGSAYAAQVGCSCHFIEGRSLQSCESDNESGAWMVSIAADESKGTVTGSVPLLASRTAQFDRTLGCQLQDE